MTDTRAVVTEFHRLLAERDLPGVTALFADDVAWDIPGATEIVPWIGKRHTASEAGACFAELEHHLDRELFEIERVLVDGPHAVTIGHLRSVVRATGKAIETPFAIEMTVERGRITRYVMFEDSWRVAEAVLP
ncbi:nuclear transport factor 2 family protein [Amycolatopsis minnesotensis]|uniref:Nuclear transport factor 2 family protein n=1 Tax=Amycolatopsis minnesotensis TaxID=337894 RepID=A0ABP5DF93_9PSEU